METFSAFLTLCTGNSPVTGEFPRKGQWSGALMFSLICAWINDWVNNRDAGDLIRHRVHYDVTVMKADGARITTWLYSSRSYARKIFKKMALSVIKFKNQMIQCMLQQLDEKISSRGREPSAGPVQEASQSVCPYNFKVPLNPRKWTQKPYNQ